MLEDHVGLGFHAELGIEGIHKDYNTKTPTFRQVKNDIVKLWQIVRNHYMGQDQIFWNKSI